MCRPVSWIIMGNKLPQGVISPALTHPQYFEDLVRLG
jgi:hypothetical protein